MTLWVAFWVGIAVAAIRTEADTYWGGTLAGAIGSIALVTAIRLAVTD